MQGVQSFRPRFLHGAPPTRRDLPAWFHHATYCSPKRREWSAWSVVTLSAPRWITMVCTMESHYGMSLRQLTIGNSPQ